MSFSAENASYGALIWRRFRRHRLGFLGFLFTIFIYLVAAFTEFLAPHSQSTYKARDVYAPAQSLRFFAQDRSGQEIFQLHVLDQPEEASKDFDGVVLADAVES